MYLLFWLMMKKVQAGEGICVRCHCKSSRNRELQRQGEQELMCSWAKQVSAWGSMPVPLQPLGACCLMAAAPRGVRCRDGSERDTSPWSCHV